MAARKSGKGPDDAGKLESLGAIGPRGLLVHRGEDVETEYKYYPDNDELTWRDFPVDLVKFAKSRGIPEADVKVLVKRFAPVAVLPDNRSAPKTFLVNLDAFSRLPPPSKSMKRGASESAWPSGEDAYLLHEAGGYYALPESVLKPLPPLDEGDAKVIVKRGAVAAAIPPNDLPIGTHCILLNLTQLLPK